MLTVCLQTLNQVSANSNYSYAITNYEYKGAFELRYNSSSWVVPLLSAAIGIRMESKLFSSRMAGNEQTCNHTISFLLHRELMSNRELCLRHAVVLGPMDYKATLFSFFYRSNIEEK